MADWTLCWPITSICFSARSHSPAKQSSSKRNVRRGTSVGLAFTSATVASMAPCSWPASSSSLAVGIASPFLLRASLILFLRNQFLEEGLEQLGAGAQGRRFGVRLPPLGREDEWHPPQEAILIALLHAGEGHPPPNERRHHAHCLRGRSGTVLRRRRHEVLAAGDRTVGIDRAGLFFEEWARDFEPEVVEAELEPLRLVQLLPR